MDCGTTDLIKMISQSSEDIRMSRGSGAPQADVHLSRSAPLPHWGQADSPAGWWLYMMTSLILCPALHPPSASSVAFPRQVPHTCFKLSNNLHRLLKNVRIPYFLLHLAPRTSFISFLLHSPEFRTGYTLTVRKPFQFWKFSPFFLHFYILAHTLLLEISFCIVHF